MSRSISIDFIRFIAIICVVTVHVTDVVVGRTNYLGGVSWWIATVLNTLGRLGVPFFILISGALILKDPTKGVNSRISSISSISSISNNTKLLKRILVPLFLWGVIYLYWHHIWFGDLLPLGQQIKAILSGELYHLYFLFIIAGLYVVTPFLNRKFVPLKEDIKLRVVLCAFLLGILLVALLYLLKPSLPIINIFTYFIPFTGFFLAGNYLKPISLTKLGVTLLSGAFLLLLILTSCLTFFNYSLKLLGNDLFWTKMGGQYFGDYLSPNIILLSLFGYLLLKTFGESLTLIPRSFYWLITTVAITSFGIYLVHPIVIDMLDRYGEMAVHLISGNLTLYLLEKIYITLHLSFVATYFLFKVPYLKPLFGK